MINISKKILLITKNDRKKLAIEKLFEIFDAEIIKADTGEKAVEKAAEHDFALAIVEEQSSENETYAILNLLQGHENTRLLPLVIIAEKYPEQYYSIKGIYSGNVPLLTKPVKSTELTSITKTYLDLYETRKRLEYETDQCSIYKQALQNSENRLSELSRGIVDKLKSAFIANVSHEIRTPMNSIVGFTNLLAEDDLTKKQKLEYISYINDSSMLLINLIENIIDIAKIEAGQLKIKSEPVHLEKVLLELNSMFSQEIINKGLDKIEIKYTNIDDDKNIVIRTDKYRFRQVMICLLSNAIKLTPHGLIEYGYEITDNNIKLFVKDSGIGIHADKLDLIFDRFEYSRDEYYAEFSSAGIGLSLAKKLVELMGSNLIVKSEVDVGSTFYFELPYDRIEYISAKDSRDTDKLLASKYNWKDKTLLIAEDKYENFFYLNESLESTGIKIIWAKDGEEAVQMVKEYHIDIICMDINMPKLSGIDAFYKIKKLKPDIPVIAQTVYTSTSRKDICFEIGFNDYLSKPFSSHDLLERMSRIFKLEKAH
jgi:signal transduction histidine kinase/ActR/RegA family two-component response regulator